MNSPHGCGSLQKIFGIVDLCLPMYVYHWSIIIFSFSLGEFNSPSTQIWTTWPKPVPHRWPQSNQGVTKRPLGNPRGLAMDTYIYIYSWENGGFFRPHYWLPEGLSWASCVLFINFYTPWNKKGKKNLLDVIQGHHLLPPILMTWSKSQGPPGARAALFLKPVWMDTMVLKGTTEAPHRDDSTGHLEGWRVENCLGDGSCI